MIPFSGNLICWDYICFMYLSKSVMIFCKKENYMIESLYIYLLFTCMWLFDNIFLDKDTPTAMLDPLLADKKKEEIQLDEKAVANLPESPESKKDPEATIWIDSISFDDIEEHEPVITLNTQSSTENPVETPSIEDISFDIGGFDDVQILSQDSVVETPSDNQTQTSSEPIVSFDIASTPSIDASIALVQGATSATSDAIMQTQSETVNWADTIVNIISLTQETQSTQDSIESSWSVVAAEDSTNNSQDNSLMDIIWDSSAQVSEPSLIINIPDSESTTIEPVIDLFSETVTPIAPFEAQIEAQIPVDNVSTNVWVTPNVITSVSDSSVLVESFASHNRFSSISSPVDDMLIEFISKLEKFNSESTTLDTQMTTSEIALQQEEDDLRKEFEIRMSAISYKRQHMTQIKNERLAEKSRLEKIISHLKNEVA